jgi:hypothetical protein
MNIQTLEAELDRALIAEIESDEQVRQLTGQIERVTADGTTTTGPPLSATDCAKLVTAALAVNDRLRQRRMEIDKALKAAKREATPSRLEMLLRTAVPTE